jgi:hypothetical protein
MKKLLTILILFVFYVQAQVTILPFTKCHGFNMTTSGGIIKLSDPISAYLETSVVGTYTCIVDTAINLTGYDSLKITVCSWSTHGGPNNYMNSIPLVHSNPFNYTYTTTNLTTLALNFTLTQAATPNNITVLSFVTIEGYPTTSFIKKNSKTNEIDFFAHKNTLTLTDQIKGNYQLVVFDLSGKSILSKKLDQTNELDLPTNFYLVQIISDNVAIRSKKVFISN